MMRPLFPSIAVELAPFEGRLATAWRVAALCALTTLVFMTYGIPLVPIACYLILFVMKPDPAESILMAIGISVLVSVVVGLLLFLIQISIEIPLWRLVIIATSSFLFLYIGVASQLGPAGSIIALVIAFVMTLISDVPFGEVATRALLYAWLMALVPMGLIISFNAAFGRSASRLLRRGVAGRLRLVAQSLDGDTVATKAVLAAVRQGNGSLESYAKFVRLFHLVPKAEGRALTVAIPRTYAMMLAIARPSDIGSRHGDDPSESDFRRLRSWLTLLADTVEDGGLTTEASQTCKRAASLTEKEDDSFDPTGDDLRFIVDQLSNVSEPQQKDLSKRQKEGFFRADALTNPVYQRFALKTTASALICYIIYTALDWQDIHTAMITCYVAALGTTGETLHKLTLRIVGCLIGAAMGILSIVFFMPLMTSIGELMLLVFAGTLCAAWVSSGSEKMSYAGVQIGLAFLLTVLQGFGPDVQLSVAMDRIIGILLGNTVLYLVFTRVWPVSSATVVKDTLSRVIDTFQARLADGSAYVSLSPQVVAKVLTSLDSSREELALLHFEPTNIRPPSAYLGRLHAVIDQLEIASLQMALPLRNPPVSSAQMVQLRQALTAETA